MRNIQPWCISRQLWWGHRIPAWYGPDGKIFVAETEGEASSVQAERSSSVSRGAAGTQRRGRVLDTWFSVGPLAVFDARTGPSPHGLAFKTATTPGAILVTGLRHHLLLGRAHDDDGASTCMKRGALPRPCTSTRSYATRQGPEDVQVRGERDRSRWRTHGPVRHGCGPVHTRCDGRAGTGYPARREIVSKGYRNFITKLWNAAARFSNSRGTGAGRIGGSDPRPSSCSLINRWIDGRGGPRRRGPDQPLDRGRGGPRRPRGDRSARGVPVRRGGSRRSYRFTLACRTATGIWNSGEADAPVGR